MFADFTHGFHVGFDFNTEFFCEQVHKLYGRSCGTAAEPPYVGVQDVHAVDYRHHRRRQAVAGCTMGVEIDRNFHGGLEFRDNGGGTQRAYQACHILKSDYLGAETFHFAGFFHEVFVGEYFLGLFRLFAEELGEETGFLRRFGLGVYGVADGAVGDAAKLVDEADGLADVVDVVESVEYTHHVEAVGDSLFIETFENAVGVGHITEEVAAAGRALSRDFLSLPWRWCADDSMAIRRDSASPSRAQRRPRLP